MKNKKEFYQINNNSENEEELKNIEADKLTRISDTLIFTIPIIIWVINLICPITLYGEIIVFLIKFVIPISVIVGLTLLVYIRIKYPNNQKSKKLVKTCIFAAIAIALIYSFIFFTCINIISNIEGCPG